MKKEIMLLFTLCISTQAIAGGYAFRQPLHGVDQNMYLGNTSEYGDDGVYNNNDCHDSDNVGYIGDAGACDGLLIVNNSLLSDVVDMEGQFFAHGTVWSADDVYTGQVTSTLLLFSGMNDFNEDIGYWDMSNVYDMRYMFNGADNFNQNIGGWDVSNAGRTSYMFNDADSFNQDLSRWDVSNMFEARGMFYGADTFNGDLSRWDTSSLDDAYQMFAYAESFNSDISGWDMENALEMSGMFAGADAFAQDLSCWNVENVTERPASFASESVIEPIWGTTGCEVE